jgi:uncharacterized protein (DUF427 family)
VLADSNETKVVENNRLLSTRVDSRDYFKASSESSVCPLEGNRELPTTSNVNGEKNPGAAWYYPEPKDAAAEIKDHVAFWRGVDVQV